MNDWAWGTLFIIAIGISACGVILSLSYSNKTMMSMGYCQVTVVGSSNFALQKCE